MRCPGPGGVQARPCSSYHYPAPQRLPPCKYLPAYLRPSALVHVATSKGLRLVLSRCPTGKTLTKPRSEIIVASAALRTCSLKSPGEALSAFTTFW